MNKQIFNLIYGHLGSVARTRVKVIKHKGSGTNEGLEVIIAYFKDIPFDGLTTLASLSLSASKIAACIDNDLELPTETVEYICAVPNELSDEFAQTDFQYYLMASLANDWSDQVGHSSRISNSPFKTDHHLLAEPLPWPELPLRFQIASKLLRLVWFFPLLLKERDAMENYTSAQLQGLLIAKRFEVFDLNRQSTLI